MADTSTTEKLFDLIKDIRVSMMTTVDDEGLRSRPMYNHTVDDQHRLWFFSREHSAKTGELSRDGQVNLSYADPGSNTYVSVSGTGELVHDREKMKELWSEGLRAWFPKGSDDPDMVLICVQPTRGEYWDQPSSTFVQVYGFAKAMLTGQSPKVGDVKKVQIA